MRFCNPECGRILTTALYVASLVTAASAQANSPPMISLCLTDSEVPQELPDSDEFEEDTKPFNTRLPFVPAALAIPETVEHVQAAVICAVDLDVSISARGGGHSYAAHGLGGEDNHLVLDMKNFNSVALDTGTNVASIGPGALLGKVATELYDQGGRALSHGTCPT